MFLFLEEGRNNCLILLYGTKFEKYGNMNNARFKKNITLSTMLSRSNLILLFMFCFLIYSFEADCQSKKRKGVRIVSSGKDSSYGKRGDNELRVVFYNVENLFDPYDDTLTMDEEYTPTGMRGWTYGRMIRKQVNISKSIMAIGGFRPPEIVGLCEIENRFVILGLLKNTPLKNYNYKIVHHESPDTRGIDVALIYLPDKFQVLHNEPIHITFPFEENSKTRDILYVMGRVNNGDTLHIFVNHWPSKFGGLMATTPKRNHVASVLRSKVDSILNQNINSKILIMGDLNDGPTDESVKDVLKASLDSTNIDDYGLYNTLAGSGMNWNKGTIKFRGEWETIDHIIINKQLAKDAEGLRVKKMGAVIFDAPFLLQEDKTFFGKKPYRTYYGAQYIGGFSDHLPIYIDLHY
jgi:endonuclease/exonuclease/phosphatase family metal-dependent hydrolase